MTAEPVTVPASTSVEVALSLMNEHGIHHLPVVDGERPVGMLGFRQAARRARGPRASASASSDPHSRAFGCGKTERSVRSYAERSAAWPGG